MKKRDTLLLVGAALIVFGLFMFFKTTRISSWGVYRVGRNISTGGILIALTLFDLVLLVATRHKATKILLPILISMIVLSIIMGTQLYYHGTLLVPAAVGAGLLLRALLLKPEKTNE